MPRPHAETSKRVLARIQRLCCLGIGGEMLLPDLMRELAGLIPFRNGFFGWAGPDSEFTNGYAPYPIPMLERYYTEYHNTHRESELITTFRELLSAPVPRPVYHALRHLRVDHRTFLRSDYYNNTWRPADIYEPLAMVVREAGRNHGLLYFWRAAGEAPFEPNDIALLESIAGFVAHGMTRAALDEDAFADSDDRALFLADRDGALLHASSRALTLLMMALNARMLPSTRWRGVHEPAPEIARLCRTLAATANGQIGQPPPVLRLRNPWGEFVLRAYWFEPTDGAEQTRQIGITIERRVPRALALLRRVEDLPLTAREKQVCLLLARDPSRQDLADAMGVAASTVITHQRSLYSKLDVHSRAGLLAALQVA